MFYPNSNYSIPPTIFLVKSFIPAKSIYTEPIQGLNLNRRYISGLEPKVPVTRLLTQLGDQSPATEYINFRGGNRLG